jgi:hypothetical protein
VIGGIVRIADAMLRAMLYEAANVLLSRTVFLGAQAMTSSCRQEARHEARLMQQAFAGAMRRPAAHA